MNEKDGKQAKHTPGPWRVSSRPDGCGGTDVLVVSNFGAICDCFQGLAISSPRGERANARLIAAAPELLAACMSLLAVIPEEFMDYPAIGEAEEAISKAKGE